MKKSSLLFERLPFTKMGFLPILLTFLFFAAMQIDLKAQSTTLPGATQNAPAARTITMVPTGQFVTVNVAIERLKLQVNNLKNQLSQLAEGSNAYNNALRRYQYFSHIIENLEAGKGVAESIQLGLGAIYNSLNGGASPDQAATEKNAAILLLRP